MAGFAVAVKLIDLATGPLGAINKAIGSLDKSAKKVAREGGLFEARDALKDIREQAKDVGETLTRAFTPLEGLIGGVASGGVIGGLALMAQRFASVGTEVGRTSATLGLNTVDLQKWRGGAELAGVSAEAMTTSLQGAAHGIYLMRNGLDPAFGRIAARFGLDLTKGATDAAKAMNLTLQLADAFQNNPLLKGNFQAQKTLLEQLGYTPEMQYYILLGRKRLEELNDETQRHGHLTETQIARAFELQHAYSGLTQSVESTSLAIGAQTSTWLTPLLLKMSDWLDALRATPGAMETVGTASTALAAVLGGGLLLKLLRIVGLFSRLGLIGVGAAAAGGLGAWLKGQTPNIPRSEWEPGLHKDRSGEAPGLGDIDSWLGEHGGNWWRRDRSGEARTALRDIDSWLGEHGGNWWRSTMPPWMGGTQKPGPRKENLPPGTQGLLAPHEAASQNLAANNPGNLRALGGGWQSFESPEAGIRGVGDWLSRWYDRGKRTIGDLVSTYSPPNENDTATLTARAAGRLNVSPNAPINVEDPEIKRNLVQAFLRNEWGGQLPRGYTDEQIGAALGGSRPSAAIGTRSALPAIPDLTLPDVNVMAPRAPTAAQPGAPAVPTAAEPAQGAAGPQSMNLDSSHRVEVSFLNAPTGMRTGLTQAQGPAEVAVRTHYAMDALS